MFERVEYEAECGHMTSSAVGVPRKRFCSMGCAAAHMERRSKAFGDATSSAQGKPPDGVTYGKGKSA